MQKAKEVKYFTQGYGNYFSPAFFDLLINQIKRKEVTYNKNLSHL